MFQYNFTSVVKHPLWIHTPYDVNPLSVADLRGARETLGEQILSISCIFWEILAKSYVGAPGELAPPPRGNPGSATAYEGQLIPWGA